jgi:UDP-4-amino-4,6-dideoxy-N-acetyl-beta-L-altrosamine transaminase
VRKNIPYGRQYIDNKDIKAVVDVLRSDYLTQGSKVEEFEEAICDYTGSEYCVAVANGTAALHLAVAALELNIGGEGIVPPITFVATANSLVYNRITPVFADINPNTGNIEPEEVKKRINKSTQILIPVHFAGQTADMKALFNIARLENIRVIEDASHAIGSKYTTGEKVGSNRYSDLTTFSFHPVKTITTGEGGAITTNNNSIYRRLRLLRSHGITKDANEMTRCPGPWYYEMNTLGYNYRLTDIQAVLGISQLKKLDYFVKRRREIITRYIEAFRDLDWINPLEERNGAYNALHIFVVLIDFDKIGLSRKKVMNRLKAKGINTQVHYIPVHLHPYYRKEFGTKAGDCPNAEYYYERCLTLPLYPMLSDEEQDMIIMEVKALA